MIASSRSEFLPQDDEFRRAGGCFVTTKRAIMFFLLAVCSALVVAGLMYFYGPSINQNQSEQDIEKLLNDTLSELQEEHMQLSGLVYPLYYRLRLEPDVDQLSFAGRVTITLKVNGAVNEIVLHSHNLQILEVNLTTTEEIEFNSYTNDPDNSKLNNATYENVAGNVRSALHPENISQITHTTVANTARNILHAVKPKKIEIISRTQQANSPQIKFRTKANLDPAESYTLDITFSGNITEDLKGFYKASFLDINRKKQTIITTDFEPIYARRVFPCFDEPVYKAIFEISIARKTSLTSLSNMPIRETEPMPNKQGWVWDHFKKSPPMSTYAVSFTIFDFKGISSNENIRPMLKVWAPEEQIPGAKYILQSAGRILKFLENFLNTRFPLLKLDFVVIPNFIKESSENWGLIYLSDEALIRDISSPDSNQEAKMRIFHTIAHDLSHQWFGNLVTMKWWSDIWLNEGLANYLANKAEDSLEPGWNILSNYAFETTEVALTIDKLKTTHTLRDNITAAFKIEQMFDTLVQTKGSCLLRMLDFTVGEDQFRKGLQAYLHRWAYNATSEEDFWQSFPTGPNMILPNITLKQAMESWTLQKGFPLVTIIRNYTTGDVLLSQQRFLEQNDTDDTLWHIPISYKDVRRDDIIKMWLVEKETLIPHFTTANSDEWLLFNIEETGFYRVKYDLQNWRLLSKQMQQNISKIPAANRAQLIDDAFELAENGHLQYDIPINLLKYLPTQETEYAPWASGLSNLQILEIILHNTKFNGMFQTYLLNLILPIYNKLFPGNNIIDSNSTQLNDRLLKKLILQTACEARFQPCIEWSQKMFSLWMNSSDAHNPIPYNYRDIAYCTAIKMGGKKEWNFLWNQTTLPMSSGDLKRAYSALGCARDPWLINNYLEHTLDGTIAIQSIPIVWQSVTRSVGLHIGFKFLRLNWDKIYKKFGEMRNILITIFDDFLSNLSSKVDLEDLTTFYRTNSKTLKSVSPLVKQSVDKIKLRIYWWDKHMANVTKWLIH